MKRTLSLFSANLLYLVSMLLVLFLGSTVQSLNLTIGLIVTEFLLILLPVLVFLPLRHIPFKEGLRLNKISWKVAVLSLLLGVSTYVFSVLIEEVMMKLSGMPPVDVPAGSMPDNILFYILYVVALAVSAPICEEALFRGAIQGAYESRKSTALAIIVPTLMFAFFHFRLSGLPGLLPISFLLGYVAWRTRSIYSSILVHVGINGTASAVTILALNGITIVKEFSNLILVSAGGLVVTLVLLALFIRVQPRPVSEESPEEPRKKWLAVYWPLIIAGLLYLVIVGITFFSSLPKAAKTLVFTPPALESPLETRYQAVNRAGDVVGEMECTFTPNDNTFTLDCSEDIKAYEVRIDNSMWSDSGHSAELHAVWDGDSMQLLQYRKVGSYDGGGEQTSQIKDGSLITTSFFDSYEPLSLSCAELVEYEWVWRVNHLDTSEGSLFETPFVYLMRWDDTLKKSLPILQTETLKLQGNETITVPAGEFKTSKVTLDGQSAWYLAEENNYPLPIQFDDGMVTFSLME